MMERLGPESMLILLSAPPRVYSGDVDYEYRQDSNLYYLTGITQEDTALVLMPGNASHREFLFVKDRDAALEHWRGRSLTHEEASERSGVATVLSTRDFQPFLAAMLSRRTWANLVDEADASAFFAALGQGRARLALAVERAGPADLPAPPQRLLRDLRDRHVGFVPIDATPLLTDLRIVKTPYELRMLETATAISIEAQIAGMHAAEPGVFEYQVKAAIEAVHRARGAVSPAYPSIVGSGPNATILHYPQGARQLEAGDLLLVDAAANFAYQASDLTRTYPVNGTFTAPQRDIYALVLRAQEAAIDAAKPGATLATIHARTVDVLKQGLVELGLITDTSGEQYRMWFTHSTSHFIGIDVHDVGDRNTALQPGMTFTIEPGLYIRQEALDALPRTAANLALIEKVQPAVSKYLGIGVRIEDDFVVDASGVRNLSAELPRGVDEIEAAMRQRGGAEGNTRASGGR